MVIVLRHDILEGQKQDIHSFLSDKGFRVREIQGEQETILGAVGLQQIDLREVELLPGVSRVIPITSPYKLASREFRKIDTEVPVGPITVGGARIVVIAGPCAVESRDQILEIARTVRDSGAVILRGGAYKPRTSPYAFQGLGEEGLRYLKEAGEAVGMPVISEIVSPEHADLFRDHVDIVQIGARNMQNFELLKRVGELGKPVLLKRGLAATIEDLLMSAEYILAHGTDSIILCERGIRTFETYTRNTLDLTAIPVIKKLSHLPAMVDPSHGTGIREKVLPMARAAIAAGAHGIICEVHTDPDRALSDGPQSLYPSQFEKLMRDVEALAPVLEKELATLPVAPSSATASATAQATASITPVAEGEVPDVAFQGRKGAFSHKAIRRFFDRKVRAVSKTEFREIFQAVLEGSCRYGMIPMENSLTGSIHQNYDLLLQFPDIRIVGEKTIRIIHNLIGKPGTSLESIRRVYSHPQALAQCAAFLEHYPSWEQVSYYDTAGSVALISEKDDAENAAIASEEAAEAWGLEVLKPSIETNVQNYTRFFVIARHDVAEAEARADTRKASFIFSTPDRPGALAEALTLLARREVNLHKLESRPIPDKPWEYMFYIDVEIPEDRSRFAVALRELQEMSAEGGSFRLLGEYPA